MISKDLTLNADNELIISNGDFAIEQTDDQNIEAILIAEKGQFYEFPLLGYGITRRLYGSFNRLKERKDIRESLRRDNYDIITLEVTNDFEVFVDANKTK